MPTDKDAAKTTISATARRVLVATELKNSRFTFMSPLSISVYNF